MFDLSLENQTKLTLMIVTIDNGGLFCGLAAHEDVLYVRHKQDFNYRLS